MESLVRSAFNHNDIINNTNSRATVLPQLTNNSIQKGSTIKANKSLCLNESMK